MRLLLLLLLTAFAALIALPTFAAADTGDPLTTLQDVELESLPVLIDLEPADISDGADPVFDVGGGFPGAPVVLARLTTPRSAALRIRTGPDGFRPGIWRPADYAREFASTHNYESGLDLRRG